MSSNMAEAVLVVVQSDLEQDVARTLPLGQLLQSSVGADAQLDQFLAERVLEANLILVYQPDGQADILVRIVGCDSGVRRLLAQLVPALQVIPRVIEKRREGLLRVFA